MVRSAAAGSAIAARLPPTAAASAFRSSEPATGTTATVSSPSTSATSVLKTRSGETPRAWAASSPYDAEDGSCSYACTVNRAPAAVSATVAGVPPAAFFFANEPFP
ncbi:hypothetical protein A8W25_07020 [Streptomyces sp. ERV7]|nr:hypothetical protein A8W25_07020 [Streptomyces sp. ERV7]